MQYCDSRSGMTLALRKDVLPTPEPANKSVVLAEKIRSFMRMRSPSRPYRRCRSFSPYGCRPRNGFCTAATIGSVRSLRLHFHDLQDARDKIMPLVATELFNDVDYPGAIRVQVGFQD